MTPIAIVLRSLGFDGTAFFAALGLSGIFIYLVARISKRIIQGSVKSPSTLLEIGLLLMTITVFSRYLYHTFWDYPGILSVPLFLFAFVRYIKKETARSIRITLLSLVFIILTIPLIGVNSFYKSPRQLIPEDWYNPYDFEEHSGLTLPWEFETTEAYDCSVISFDLKVSENYSEAIESYLKCLEIENNPRFYFELAQCYSEIGELNIAIDMLDSLIRLDSSFSVPYNNRGLMYYTLKEHDLAIRDYKKAIELDSSKAFYYSNLGLAYYYEYQFEDACSNFLKAQELGKELSDFSARIVRAKCK